MQFAIHSHWRRTAVVLILVGSLVAACGSADNQGVPFASPIVETIQPAAPPAPPDPDPTERPASAQTAIANETATAEGGAPSTGADQTSEPTAGVDQTPEPTELPASAQTATANETATAGSQ